MGSAQVYGLLTASFLILTLLADSTAACYCQGQVTYLNIEYCKSDVVIKGKFQNAIVGEPQPHWIRYVFEPTQVYKIPNPMIDIRSLYTQLLGTTCAYRHNDPFSDVEYIVTGYIMGNDIIIDMCNIIRPWNQLYTEDQQALDMNVYTMRCALMP